MHKNSKNALEIYYKNPNTCDYCNNVIHVPIGRKPAEVRKKKFCNRYCMGKSHSRNNENKPKKIKFSTSKKLILEEGTKMDIFFRSKNWQSARSSIQKIARKKYKESNKPKKCKVCKYDKHYEVCHIKSVSSFNDDCLISEINHLDNLVALCPNCHWEFDHGILRIN